jgi:hypothetical protein
VEIAVGPDQAETLRNWNRAAREERGECGPRAEGRDGNAEVSLELVEAENAGLRPRGAAGGPGKPAVGS